MGESSVRTNDLILVPALITLTVTLIRLVGELFNWSSLFFNREAGGPGALIGIVWLVPIFGAYFAVKLSRAKEVAGAGRTLGFAALGLAAFFAVAFIGGTLLPEDLTGQILVMGVGSLIGIWITTLGNRKLSFVMLSYGLAARLPVVLIMLPAMLGNWGTHYDASPPGMPEMGTLLKWVVIGVIPQLTTWMAFTVILGTLIGGIIQLLYRPPHRAEG